MCFIYITSLNPHNSPKSKINNVSQELSGIGRTQVSLFFILTLYSNIAKSKKPGHFRELMSPNHRLMSTVRTAQDPHYYLLKSLMLQNLELQTACPFTDQTSNSSPPHSVSSSSSSRKVCEFWPLVDSITESDPQIPNSLMPSI